MPAREQVYGIRWGKMCAMPGGEDAIMQLADGLTKDDRTSTDLFTRTRAIKMQQ